MKRYYTVTQKHIDKSDYFDSAKNPLALAIREILHRPVYISPTTMSNGSDGDYDTSSGRIVSFKLSKNAKNFIEKFYQYKKVNPITFSIETVE
jgi:hypothetical protein